MAYTKPAFKMSVNKKNTCEGNVNRTTNDIVHKIVVLGYGGVGKSALTLRYMYDTVRNLSSILIFSSLIKVTIVT